MSKGLTIVSRLMREGCSSESLSGNHTDVAFVLRRMFREQTYFGASGHRVFQRECNRILDSTFRIRSIDFFVVVVCEGQDGGAPSVSEVSRLRLGSSDEVVYAMV